MTETTIDDATIDDMGTLRDLYGEPGDRAVQKQRPQLDKHCRNFIALSPFVLIASAGTDGTCDCSPKGDAPGFVSVLDDNTILIPDRIGNNRIDTLSNVVDNPHVGLLFMVPGMNETLRINGRVTITTDAALLESLAVQGKAPKTGMLVDVKDAYLHCAKALIRSDLWNPETQIERESFPSMGRMIADQIEGMTVEEAEKYTETSIRERMY